MPPEVPHHVISVGTGCSLVLLHNCYPGAALSSSENKQTEDTKYSFSSVLLSRFCFLDLLVPSFFFVYSLLSDGAHLLFFETLHVSSVFSLSLYLVDIKYGIQGPKIFLRNFEGIHPLLLSNVAVQKLHVILFCISLYVSYILSLWKILKSSLSSGCSKVLWWCALLWVNHCAGPFFENLKHES